MLSFNWCELDACTQKMMQIFSKVSPKHWFLKWIFNVIYYIISICVYVESFICFFPLDWVNIKIIHKIVTMCSCDSFYFALICHLFGTTEELIKIKKKMKNVIFMCWIREHSRRWQSCCHGNYSRASLIVSYILFYFELMHYSIFSLLMDIFFLK